MAPAIGTGTSRPPSHIIVFKRKSERNAEIVAEVMGGAAASVATRGTLELRSMEPFRSASSVYPRLGVAAVDLTDEEAGQLREGPDVADVIANQLYTLPPYTVELTNGEIGAALAARTVPLSAGSDPMAAFLHGIRTAADAALEYRSHLQGPQGEAAAAAGTAHSWPLELLRMPTGYNTATGRGVKIAVLDTGIDQTHPDLRDRIKDPSDIESFVPGQAADDGNGHGTHCAGVIAGAAEPVQGERYGVAPDAELLIGKVLDNSGWGYTDQILKGIQWAADKGANIISISIQILRSVNQQPSPAFQTIAETLLDENPGILLVGAAGNASNRPHFISPVVDPAACRSILAVAAIDRQKQIASFSCGQRDSVGDLNCSAPGVGVRSAWPGGTYRSVSGTSMATPHVAGLAALWLESNPGWTAGDLWRELESSCVPPNFPGTDFGRGLPQAP